MALKEKVTPISKHEENDKVPELRSTAHFKNESKLVRTGEATTALEPISQNVKSGVGQKPLWNLTYSHVVMASG